MTESVHKGVSPSFEVQNPIIDKNASKWESLLLHLVVFALLLPSAWQSISSGLLGLTFLYQRGWRSEVWSTEVGTQFLKALGLMGSAWMILLILGGIEVFQSSDGKSISPYLRLVGKQGLWGGITIASMIYFQFSRLRNFLSLRALIVFTGALLAYAVLQRYTGVDWVHGFSASLGDHRYAYDVYRVSGWMDHPLTFGFNLMLVALVAFAQTIALWKKGDYMPSYLWAVQTILILALLLLTQSRFPIALTFGLMTAGMIWQFPKSRLWAVSMAIVLLMTGFLIWSRQGPDSFGRWSELFDSKQALEQRFDRIIFWKINWQMFQESPWVGTGLKDYGSRLLDTYLSAGYTSLERKYNAHNIYLQTLADMGALGGIGLALVLLAIGRLAIRMRRSFQHIALPLLFVATLGSGLVQNNLRDTEYLFALWISIGLSLSWLIVQGKPDDSGSERKLEDLKP